MNKASNLNKTNQSLIPESNENTSLWVSVITLFLISFSIRFFALMQSGFANGWQGYSHLLVIKELYESGQFYSFDLAIWHWLMILVNLFVQNPILSLKISSGIVAGCFTGIAFYLGHQLKRSLVIATALASYTVCSPHLTYAVSQFPEDVLGIVLLMLLFITLSQKKIVSTLCLCVICLSSSWLIICLTLPLFVHFIRKEQRHIQISYLKVFGFISSSVLIIRLYIADLFVTSTEVVDLFSWWPQFAPYTFIQSFGANDMMTFIWFLEILLVCFLVIYLMVTFNSQNKQSKVLFLSSLLLIFPFFAWEYQGLSFRSFLIFGLMIPLLFTAQVRLYKEKRSLQIWSIFSVGLLLLTAWTYDTYQPSRHDPNYEGYLHSIETIEQKIKGEAIEGLIVHDGLSEMIRYHKTIPVVRLEEVKADQLSKYWRIAKDIRISHLEDYLDEGALTETHNVGVRSWLIREDRWHDLITAAIDSKDDYLLEHITNWRNPGFENYEEALTTDGR